MLSGGRATLDGFLKVLVLCCMWVTVGRVSCPEVIFGIWESILSEEQKLSGPYERGAPSPAIAISSVSNLSDALMLEVASIQDATVFHPLPNHHTAQSCMTRESFHNLSLAQTSKRGRTEAGLHLLSTWSSWSGKVTFRRHKIHAVAEEEPRSQYH